MDQSIRRQLRFLYAYVVTSAVVVGLFAVAALARRPAPENLGELTAERINIVDANGTLRLVISNKDRMHPGVIGGKVLQRSRPYAGIILFNDQGDEAGGLVVKGREQDGKRAADAGLMFDQLGQDQTIGLEYTEEDGQRSAGFKVWDRPDAPLSDLIEQLNAAHAIRDPRERELALARVSGGAPKSAQRVFLGKTRERAATLVLRDVEGRDRLVLSVEPNGEATVRFLDANGKVIRSLGPGR